MEFIISIRLHCLSEDLSVRYEDLSTDKDMVVIRNIDIKSFGKENLERAIKCLDLSIQKIQSSPALFDMSISKKYIEVKAL